MKRTAKIILLLLIMAGSIEMQGFQKNTGGGIIP